MTRDEMTAFLERVLEQASLPDAVAVLEERRRATSRFGQNRVTQSSDTFTRNLVLSVGSEGRKASASTHRIDPDAAGAFVRATEEAALSAPVDPEYMPPVEDGQVYPLIESYDEETAAAPASLRSDAASAAISAAESSGMEAAGLIEMRTDRSCVATSTGNMAFHESTGAVFRLTMDRGVPSSYRSMAATAWREIDVPGTVEGVRAEVLDAADPRDLPERGTDMVLEPQAVADLVPYIVYMLQAREADEGLTAFSGKLDQKVTGDLITMYSDLHGPVPGRPFDDEGLPAQDITWIENGVLRTHLCNRFWARKTGRPPVSSPGCFYLGGSEEASSADLVKRLDRGLLIRRFWYIRFIDQKELSLTGMTRDGVFWVEDGKVRFPVRDFRWNEHVLDLFARTAFLGTPERKDSVMAPPALIRGRS
ncbi:hypothetical protein JW921_05300 [Candidatus Fermentibacterales bacterium]|nr:hypothetical protein [Candidatus Fermentibacterales bacterium]